MSEQMLQWHSICEQPLYRYEVELTQFLSQIHHLTPMFHDIPVHYIIILEKARGLCKPVNKIHYSYNNYYELSITIIV